MITFKGKFVRKDVKIAIVVAHFNEFTTSKLLGRAMDSLIRNEVAEEAIDVYWILGAFEVPFMTKKIVADERYDGITTLDSVVHGSTSHYDLACNGVAKGIGQISLTSNIPVMFGVITTEDIEQAIERSGSKARNKGNECARGVLEVISSTKQL